MDLTAPWKFDACKESIGETPKFSSKKTHDDAKGAGIGSHLLEEFENSTPEFAWAGGLTAYSNLRHVAFLQLQLKE